MLTSGIIHAGYQVAANRVSDINEHVPTLRALASRSGIKKISEMGVRSGVSTWGFLQGLLDGSSADGGKPGRELVGFDLSAAPDVYQRYSNVDGHDISLRFERGDVLKAPPADCDLLFIDTFHVYGQLKRELALHAPGTRRFIVMHDTTVDAEHGEAIRCRYNVPEMVRETGIPEVEILRGLWPAVTEFLEAYATQWRLFHRYTNNNGLTILERIG